MGNSICIGFLLYKRIDLFLTVDEKTPHEHKELLSTFLQEDIIKDSICILENKNADKDEDKRQSRKLVFVRLEIDDFKFILEKYIEINESIDLKIENEGFESESELVILIEDYFSIDLGAIKNKSIINKHDLSDDNMYAMLYLINNYDKNDYLECYTADDEYMKTLGYYDCIDNCSLVKRNITHNDELLLKDSMFISIGKLSTNYFQINPLDSENVELIGKLNVGEYTFLGLYKTIDVNVNLDLNNIIYSMQEGNIRECDLLVKDIYGQSYIEASLDEDIVASSLGKLQFINSESNQPISVKSVLKSVTILLSTTIIQKGLIHSQILNKNSIIISGFITHFPTLMASIYNTLRILSNQKIKVYFLKSKINLSFINTYIKQNCLK